MLRAVVARGLHHFAYVPLLAVAAWVAFAKLLVYAQLIGVGPFGTLGKVMLVSSGFGLIGGFGMQSIVSRDLPALFARGRQRYGLRLLVQAIAVITLAALAASVLALAGMPLFDLEPTELALGVLHGWSQQAFLVTAFESRSRLQMARYARDMTVRSVLVLAGGVGAAMLGGRATSILLVESLLSLALSVAALHSMLLRAGLPWAFALRSSRLHRMHLPWRSSLIMLLGTLVFFVSGNLDRWIAADMLAREPFGQYAFAWLVLVAAQSVQALLNSGTLPLLAHRRALHNEYGARRITAILSLTTLGTGMILLLPASWLVAWGVARWMPAYSSALPLLPILLLAAAFRVADFWSSLAIVEGREMRLLNVQTWAVIVAGIGYLLWRTNSVTSLAWLAVATAVASHVASATVCLVGRRG